MTTLLALAGCADAPLWPRTSPMATACWALCGLAALWLSARRSL